MVGLDGSPHAQKAFERALALAVASGSGRPVVLHLLTVIEPGRFVEREAQHLHAATKAGAAAEASDAHVVHDAHHLLAPFEEQCRQANVRYVSVVAEGLSAKQEICRQVEDHRIDLLLLGTRGLGTLTKLLLGSVSDHCTQHATSDVMVVR